MTTKGTFSLFTETQKKKRKVPPVGIEPNFRIGNFENPISELAPRACLVQGIVLGAREGKDGVVVVPWRRIRRVGADGSLVR